MTIVGHLTMSIYSRLHEFDQAQTTGKVDDENGTQPRAQSLQHSKERGVWPGTESNCRHEDFQSSALPTELPGHEVGILLKR
jgi:hypothetical protein